jgi:hypothetical protein
MFIEYIYGKRHHPHADHLPRTSPSTSPIARHRHRHRHKGRRLKMMIIIDTHVSLSPTPHRQGLINVVSINKTTSSTPPHDIIHQDGHPPSHSTAARQHDPNDGIDRVRRLKLHRQTGITIVIASTWRTRFRQNCVCGGLSPVLATLVVSPTTASSDICKTPTTVPFQVQNVAPLDGTF